MILSGTSARVSERHCLIVAAVCDAAVESVRTKREQRIQLV